jgi:membrane protease YdiL (CAAX protease family)
MLKGQTMNQRLRKILLYLILTFSINFAMVAIFLAAGGKPGGTGMILLAMAYMLVPMIVTILVQKFIYKQPLVKPFGISFTVNRWFFVAWFTPPLIAFATMGVSLLLPGVSYTPDMSGFISTLNNILTPEQAAASTKFIADLPVHFIWLILIQALIAGTTINAIFAFGEELGWRGFLVKDLGFMGFWKSSALIGLIWGLWHTPLILMGHNYPQHPQLGVAVMTGWTLLLSPLFSYIRVKARSVIAASIFHGTINAVPGLALMLISGGDDLTVGITGLAGFIVLAVANLLLFIFDRFITREPVNQILRDMDKIEEVSIDAGKPVP